MTLVRDAQHLLDVRLGLEQEVLGAAASQDPHCALAAARLGVPHDRRALVDVGADVDRELVAVERLGGHVHADRRVSRRAGVDRDAVFVRRGQQRAVLEAELFLARAHVPAAQPVELRSAHRALEFRGGDHFAEERVGVEQHRVVEEDVVDAHHALLAQLDVVGLVRALVHREPQGEVGVVVEVRSGRHDPVHEPRSHQRDDRAHPEPRRGERPGDGERNRDVVRQHALDEQPRPLLEPCRVVRQERAVDEIGRGLLAGDGRRVDGAAGDARVLSRHSRSRQLAR